MFPKTIAGSKSKYMLAVVLLLFTSSLTAQTITTVAGGTIGDGKLATSIGITQANNILTDAAENIYFIDPELRRIRKIDAATGIVSTIAGGANATALGDGGPATDARFFTPDAMAIDKLGNIYVADGRRIRKIDAVTGIINTIAGNGSGGTGGDGGPALNAQFLFLRSMALDTAGNIYLIDGQKVRKITASTGIINTIAGTGTAGYTGDGGPAINAQLSSPLLLAIDKAGNLFIMDNMNNVIRKITAATGIISTYAGTGVSGFSGDGGLAVNAKISYSQGLTADSTGNLYITDNNRVRQISAATGIITTYIGTGIPGYSGDIGPASTATFLNPRSICISKGRNVYVADYGNYVIRKITDTPRVISTICGNRSYGVSGIGGYAVDAQLHQPGDIATDTAGNFYLADSRNNKIYMISATTGKITTVAGTGLAASNQGDGGQATVASMSSPGGLITDSAGNFYFIDGVRVVRKVNIITGIITRIAGNAASSGFSGDGGPALDAVFGQAINLAIDKEENIYVVDLGNNRIRKILKSTGIISTVAGNGTNGYTGDGGLATAASLNPWEIKIDNLGNIYISDSDSNAVRKVDAVTGIITTIAGGIGRGFSGDGGPASAAKLSIPNGLAIDAQNNLYIADQGNQRVRKVNTSTGIITTVAGGTYGYNGDNIPATTAFLNNPVDIEFDRYGNLYIADLYNYRIRKVIMGAVMNGTVFIDDNANGIKDGNENWANGIKMTINKPGFSRSVYTRNGRFTLDADTGTYVTAVDTLYYYTAVPASKTSSFTPTVKTDSVVFALQPKPGQKDLQVNIVPLDQARPGFAMRYNIVYKNKGTAAIPAATLVFVKSPKVTVSNTLPPYNTIRADTLTWVLNNLIPQDSGSIQVNASVVPPPMVANGDFLHSSVFLHVDGDLTPTDDTARIKQLVTGSYDPNDKSEAHRGTLTPQQLNNGEYLDYLIRFQNTGTDTAFRVVVADTLDLRLDWNSFQMIAASHDYQLSINNQNQLSWEFSNIMLPDSNINEKASHGYISFRIKPKTNLVLGDTIRNKAAIYFDYNLPVITNTEYTVIRHLLPLPSAPVINVAVLSYCANAATQKVKIMNLPVSTGITRTKVRLNTTALPVAADSTFTIIPQQIQPAKDTVWIEYTNETGDRFTAYPLTITPPAEPDVDVTADKIHITAPAELVTLTALNKKAGGTSPTFSFAKDRAFTNLWQPENVFNKLVINGDNLINGNTQVYIKMKTSDTCVVTTVAIDSIMLTRNVVTTGIVDVDNPAVVILGYPNPFNRNITITGLSVAKSYRIIISDNLGKQVHQQQVYNRPIATITTTSWKNGSYWITVFDSRKNKRIGTIPVIKQ